MIVYTFDYESGTYTGPLLLTNNDVDPHSNSWIVPGNATVEPPPNCGENLMPRWVNGQWVVYECVADIPDNVLANGRRIIDQLKLEEKANALRSSR